MIILILFIFIYSLIYLTVYVLAHQDPNMIKPLILMTVGMLVLLSITAIMSLILGFWYISILILFVIIGLISFLSYLTKY